MNYLDLIEANNPRSWKNTMPNNNNNNQNNNNINKKNQEKRFSMNYLDLVDPKDPVR
jgi:hypothetical protein